jgi:hypothetical protein
MKKILLASAALLVSFNVYAASGTIESGDDVITWDITNGVLTVSGTGAIPTYEQTEISYHNYQTTAPWGEYASQINSIVVSDGITDIGQYAFNGVPATSVSLGNNVNVIGQYAFAGTNIQDVVVPDSVTNIASGAFGSNANLQSLIIPEGTIFDNYMFDNPASLTVYCKGNTSICDEHLAAYGISTQALPQQSQGGNQNQGQGSNVSGDQPIAAGGSNRPKHRIYTVQEAEAVSHDGHNKIMIRYR